MTKKSFSKEGQSIPYLGIKGNFFPSHIVVMLTSLIDNDTEEYMARVYNRTLKELDGKRLVIDCGKSYERYGTFDSVH